MSNPTQDALARFQEANRPVRLPTTAAQRRELRLQRLARQVVRRAPPSRAIDHLYEELRALALAPATDQGEARYRELLKRLRALEAEDARLLRLQLAESGPLKLGEVDAALREARETLARHENAAPTDPSGKRTAS